MAFRLVPTKYTTVSIPISLHDRIIRLVEKKGNFKSVSDYVTYVLREVVVMHESEEIQDAFTRADVEMIRARFKALGYI